MLYLGVHKVQKGYKFNEVIKDKDIQSVEDDEKDHIAVVIELIIDLELDKREMVKSM